MYHFGIRFYLSLTLLFYLTLRIDGQILFETQIRSINKCCPYGQSYDHVARFCILNPYSDSDLENSFGKINVNVPICTDDEVFVEYHSTYHAIRFDGNDLKVNEETLPPDKFCIENLVNVRDVNVYDRPVIVRSCRPRSICNYITCIRRCCKTDQVMTPKRLCLNHPSAKNLIPSFYDVTSPLTNTQNQIILQGMNETVPKCLFIY